MPRWSDFGSAVCGLGRLELMAEQGQVGETSGNGTPGADFEIDVELLAFAHRYATGPVKWDILVFFGENPYNRDTAESIARRIGRHAWTVARELHDLSLMGVLERQRVNGSVVFALTRSPRIRRTLRRFVADNRLGVG
ncbi:MAG: hypothetical protein ACUVXG_07515 [Anaerolineae bacterium]